MRVLIVDDEPLARQELQYLLENLGEVEVVAVGRNGIEAVELIRTHKPDVVFLDVQMPGLDGFGVLKKLLEKKTRLPQVVFATAYDQYAVRAFEVNAVDYLLKPFDSARVRRTIEKARARMPAGGGGRVRYDGEAGRAAEAGGGVGAATEGGDGEGGAAGAEPAAAGGSAGDMLCLDRGWGDLGDGDFGNCWDSGGAVELPDAGGTWRAA